VVIAAEVEHAVDRGLDRVRAVLGADRDVAELARARGRTGAVEWKREDVGRRVPAAVLAVELLDPGGVDELDGEVAVLDPRRRQSGGDRVAELLGDVAEIDRHPPSAGWPFDRSE
jgi:hypothetical protein